MYAVKKKENETHSRSSCCGQTGNTITEGLKKVAIVGNPNVGKSVLFNNLTRHYVMVSNYPGTSVEVSRGAARIDDEEVEVIDTPGIYSLSPITEEERVARRILLEEELYYIVHVIDAKNLERMLPFTLQLLEARLPVILVLNMMDEAAKSGVEIDVDLLEKELGIPVVGTVSTTGKGVDILKRRIIGNERK
jgi:ferrous iron transport protein B